MPDTTVKRVVILGGGTAGWMAATYLAKALGEGVAITVLEAPAIPRIGVGEATIPNLQSAFFDFIGIPESEWMPECQASYKMAVKFINWRTSGTPSPQARPTGEGTDHFYHTFGRLPAHDDIPLSNYWIYKVKNGEAVEPFDYACFPATPLMDANHGPKLLDGTPVATYAWHFNAQLVADFLCRFATEKQGVVHVQDKMTAVDVDERGYLTALRTESGQTLAGDLFVDCSGFRGALINKTLDEPFLDMSDHLLCNSAVATNLPYDEAANGIEPYTSSIAMNSGWTWRIPQRGGRFGTGYVYSDKYASKEEATREFCALWGIDPETTPLNHVRFRVGRNRRAWVNNCVSIGTSSCFVEPLESTGIFFIYSALAQLVAHFPDTTFDETRRAGFNDAVQTMFEDTRDFIQAHFYFSPRVDTPFWRDNKKLTLGPDIAKKLETYRAGLSINRLPTDDSGEFSSSVEQQALNFWTNSNYDCVLAGLGYLPERPLPSLAGRPDSRAAADELFAEVKREQRRLLDSVPTTRELLAHQYQD